MNKAVGFVTDALTNPRHSRWIAPLLFVADAVLCIAVVLKVPYTEIDFGSYMEQVAHFAAGERNYANIKGSTGPLVYPAMHLYLYRIIYAVTGHGTDIRTAQWIFVGLYLAALSLAMAVYRKAKTPPYLLALLVLSKRLHSVFLLRMFNDSFVALFLWATIYAYQCEYVTTGSILFALGLGVKMSMLLPLPAIGIVLLQSVGRERAITQALVIAQVQIFIGYTFMARYTPQYFGHAFDLSRQFLYKWTVNFRFLPESVFMSRAFSAGLLAAHAALLGLFTTSRWLAPIRTTGSFSLIPSATNAPPAKEEPNSPAPGPITAWKALKLALFDPYAAEGSSGPIPAMAQDLLSAASATFVPTAILTATAIGMLCARSLHYQFYAWGYWGTPFLLWRAGWHPTAIVALWAAQEAAWNVFPSTPLSSAGVVACLAAQVLGVWWGTRHEFFQAGKDKRAYSE